MYSAIWINSTCINIKFTISILNFHYYFIEPDSEIFTLPEFLEFKDTLCILLTNVRVPVYLLYTGWSKGNVYIITDTKTQLHTHVRT